MTTPTPFLSRNVLTLSILQGPDKGHSFDIDGHVVVIGRNNPDLPLIDNTLSRSHAELRFSDNAWKIRDLDSSNGTYVNGVKVAGSSEMVVTKGDQIRCGTTLIVLGAIQETGVAGPGGSLRIDADGNLVESAIMTTVPSLDDSVIIAGPEAKNAVDNLRMIYELSTAISSVFDRQQLLEKIMDMIFNHLPADRGFILLCEDDKADLQPAVVRYRSPRHSGEVTISHTIVNHVLDKHEGVLCSNAMRDPRFAKGKSVHDYAIHSALCVPINVRGQNLGVIYIDTTVATHTYATEQLRLLTAIGFQTGLALEHARLYQAGVQAERLAATGETVAYLSHGIKNILQSLQSAADLVEMGLKRDKIDMAKKGWSILQRNLTRVHNLVLNMLAFSKVRKPNLALTQLNHIVQEVIEMLSSFADEHEIVLLADMDDALPPVAFDPDGVQQALLNLVLNAFDAVETGKGVITIKTGYDPNVPGISVSVGDNGKGIPKDYMDQIFNPFSSQKGHGGTGLGLAVVKKITEEHRGTVTVESSSQQGTTFTIHLPATSEPRLDSHDTTGN